MHAWKILPDLKVMRISQTLNAITNLMITKLLEL